MLEYAFLDFLHTTSELPASTMAGDGGQVELACGAFEMITPEQGVLSTS